MSGKYEYTEDMVEAMNTACASGITEEVIENLMSEFGFPRRSITAKLRKLDYEVPKKPGDAPKFDVDETNALRSFLEDHTGEYTAEEIATNHFPKFTSRQITGKALSLEMTGNIKPAAKKVTVKTYTDAEEVTIREMVGANAWLEEIADKLGKTINSVRGKLLSMTLKAEQRDKKGTKASPYVDIVEGNAILQLTTAEIAEKLGKTERGVKTVLARRKLACSNYSPKTIDSD